MNGSLINCVSISPTYSLFLSFSKIYSTPVVGSGRNLVLDLLFISSRAWFCSRLRTKQACNPHINDANRSSYAKTKSESR